MDGNAIMGEGMVGKCQSNSVIRNGMLWTSRKPAAVSQHETLLARCNQVKREYLINFKLLDRF